MLLTSCTSTSNFLVRGLQVLVLVLVQAYAKSRCDNEGRVTKCPHRNSSYCKSTVAEINQPPETRWETPGPSLGLD